MKVSAPQFTEFSNMGVLPFRGFLSPQIVGKAKKAVINELERLKIKVDGKISASKIQSLPIFQQTTTLSQSQCGWLKDKFGLSWQISPTILMKMLADPDKRVTAAYMKMKKFDIETLKRAFEER